MDGEALFSGDLLAALVIPEQLFGRVWHRGGCRLLDWCWEASSGAYARFFSEYFSPYHIRPRAGFLLSATAALAEKEPQR